jgi:alcohol dehydrogenase
MRAVLYSEFGVSPRVEQVPDPACPAAGVVVAVAATGLCRSDWHGWMGHDPDITLPHVPGHEFAATVVEAGPQVHTVTIGDRITAPFVCACGACPTCRRGYHQVCERQEQPGFTHWGSFADYVVVDVADVNAVRLPDSLDFDVAAGLGCRFATAYRAVTVHAAASSGEWLAVHGCGGVGLSAVMIAVAAGARVVTVDPLPAGRHRAAALGATAVIDPGEGDVAVAIRELTDGGAAASVDAIGGVDSMSASLRCLRTRGRHVQVGLMLGSAPVPADVIGLVLSHELQVFGSHGMAARDYPQMLRRVAAGELDPGLLLQRRIGLADAAVELAALGSAPVDGVTIIDPAG